MTRARALKQVIRARAAKTGERYTTARRHVLRELNEPSASALRATADKKGSLLREATKPPTSAKATVGTHAPSPRPASTKGGMSDATSIKKTGHDLAHWFAVLDAFGATEKGHTKAANHIHSDHGVPGWYSQGITVAYERARGVRVMNQKCDGAFEVSVSKMMAATPAQLIKAIKSDNWRDGIDPDLLKGLAAALKDKTSKGFVTRPDGQARFRYKWNQTTVQFNIYPKGPGKTSFVASHLALPNADAVDVSRAKWKAAVAALAQSFD
jgi:hypothetical protein